MSRNYPYSQGQSHGLKDRSGMSPDAKKPGEEEKSLQWLDGP